MRGARGVPWRSCHTDKPSPCTARAARRARVVAFREVTPAAPEGVYHSRTTPRWQPILGAPRGGETAPSLPRSS